MWRSFELATHWLTLLRCASLEIVPQTRDTKHTCWKRNNKRWRLSKSKQLIQFTKESTQKTQSLGYKAMASFPHKMILQNSIQLKPPKILTHLTTQEHRTARVQYWSYIYDREQIPKTENGSEWCKLENSFFEEIGSMSTQDRSLPSPLTNAWPAYY